MPALSLLYTFLPLSIAISALLLWRLFTAIISHVTSPLRNLPGPPSQSWIYGNLKETREAEPSVFHDAWVEEYGPTLKYKGWLNEDRLYTVDTRAINHILSHSNDYPKPQLARFNLAAIVGKGVLVVEGEQHRAQRRVMNPAFGPSQIRDLTETFVEKAQKLSAVWSAEIARNGHIARIDVLSGLNKMALDVIGLAGFNYDFNSLNDEGKPNELRQAFDVMFKSLSSSRITVLRMLKAYVPPLRLIPDRFTRRTEAAQTVMRRIGMQLLAEKKAAIVQAANAAEKSKVVEDRLQGRDLMTLLIKANMSTDIPDRQRLSDEDVLAQVPTFLIAGHETTGNATTWCLFALARAPKVQEKLRDELWNVPTENPSMDELNDLPYLDAVMRETLRLYAPVVSSLRVSAKDDVIPLNTPYTDVHGQVHDTIRIKKGSRVVIPILAMNRLKTLWGDDAFEFKPERWDSIPETVQHIPGVWGHLMSFLGGPRACIGYRFSLVEMKALMFTLIRNFEFEPALPEGEILKRSSIVQRPYIRGQVEKGAQLPLLVKPYARA